MTNRISWFKVPEPKATEFPSQGQAAVSERKWLIGGTSAHFLQSSSNVDNESLRLHQKFLMCFFLYCKYFKTSNLSTYLSFAFGSMTTASFNGSQDWSEEAMCRETPDVSIDNSYIYDVSIIDTSSGEESCSMSLTMILDLWQYIFMWCGVGRRHSRPPSHMVSSCSCLVLSLL